MASKERIKRSLSCPLVEDQDSYSFDQEPVEDVEQNIIAGRTLYATYSLRKRLTISSFRHFPKIVTKIIGIRRQKLRKNKRIISRKTSYSAALGGFGAIMVFIVIYIVTMSITSISHSTDNNTVILNKGWDLVSVAYSQIGNIGGEPYWSWYGFSNHVEWCACFVSWCADQCGYIEDGTIPKYAGCVAGVKWFQDRGQWVDGSEEPLSGMIIFFDWDDPSGSSGPQDGESDHTGIVEKVENGFVYTIEGNAGDAVKEKRYLIGYYEILGYGVPVMCY